MSRTHLVVWVYQCVSHDNILPPGHRKHNYFGNIICKHHLVVENAFLKTCNLPGVNGSHPLENR